MNKVILSEKPLIRAYNGDCMEFMKGLPDNAYDLAIVDPPYGIGHDSRGMSNRLSKSAKFKNYKGRQFKGGEWDSAPANVEYFIELMRVSSHYIIWGANHFIENIPNANSPSWVVWYKNGQCPTSTCNADCELAITSHKTAVKYYRQDWSGFGYINTGEPNKIHPTQKPVQLYSWLLKNYAKDGDRILDTHGGSMSSAIACHTEGFDLDICELDEDYFNDAVKRFKLNTIQERLF